MRGATGLAREACARCYDDEMRGGVHSLRFLQLASLAALVGIPLAVACGEDPAVPIPDPTAPDTGPGADSGSDSPAVSETGTPDDGGPGVDAADVTCPDVAPDDAQGIFVTPTGMNSGTCGTRAAPCKSISFSVTRAGAAFRTKVFAAAGTYVEKVTLAAGVDVIGGWEVTGTTWKRACVAPEDLVVVRAPALQNITVEARDLGGEARMSLLRIESKVALALVPGESVYGVVATGTTTSLVLYDVDVVMGSAASGANGHHGDAGTPGAASCAPGPNAVATPGTLGGQGTGAPLGTYTSTDEYVPGTATAGSTGTPGDNGAAGGAAPACVQCGDCPADPMACIFIPTPGKTSCGTAGKNGCGGGPGMPGGPALGGGSDIGVFAWDATVTIHRGSVKSGDAGNGGTGGAGGAGGAGTAGAVGAPGDACTTSCAVVAGACTPVMTKGPGGTAGGAGAVGGVGGAGGGGGGGSSFATYQGGQAVVSIMGGTTLSHGKAGKGGPPDAGAGATGVAADHVP